MATKLDHSYLINFWYPTHQDIHVSSFLEWILRIFVFLSTTIAVDYANKQSFNPIVAEFLNL